MSKDVYDLVEFLRNSATLISESERHGMLEYVDVDAMLSEIMARVYTIRGEDDPNDDGYVGADESMETEAFYDDEYVHDDEDA